MLKGKDYDWQDSNLALFGSDLERNVSGFVEPDCGRASLSILKQSAKYGCFVQFGVSNEWFD